MNVLRRVLLPLALLAVLLPLRPYAASAPEKEPASTTAEKPDETDILMDNLWWMLPITGGVFLLGGGGLLLWVRHGGMEAFEEHWDDADDDESAPN